MNFEDQQALAELANEMTWWEAVKFIRGELGCSASCAGQTARTYLSRCPNSKLWISYFELPEDSSSRKMFH